MTLDSLQGGWNALVWACGSGYTEIVGHLLATPGVNVNSAFGQVTALKVLRTCHNLCNVLGQPMCMPNMLHGCNALQPKSTVSCVPIKVKTSNVIMSKCNGPIAVESMEWQLASFQCSVQNNLATHCCLFCPCWFQGTSGLVLKYSTSNGRPVLKYSTCEESWLVLGRGWHNPNTVY
jgi:hypothetical protein